MKIVKQGFKIQEICDSIPSIESDDQTIKLVTAYAGGETRSRSLSADDITALIDALTEARRLLVGEKSEPRKLIGLRDDNNDTWYVTADGGFALCDNPRSRKYVDDKYGPVTEIYAD